jgi:hypothetical protein
MAELIHTLRRSRDVYSEKLRQLLTLYQKYPRALYCVFEGEDAKYYGIRIDALVGVEDRRHIPCRGKEDVLKLYERVAQDERLAQHNILFFIDHDFDGVRGYQRRANLYVTPCYSVENFYIGENALRKIFIAEYGVENFSSNDELDTLLRRYSRLLTALAESLTTLNAWIVLQREKEGPSSKLNLSNKKLADFVRISLDEVEQRYNREDLVTLFPEAVAISDEELQEKERELQAVNRACSFRGKYFVEFLRVFLQMLKNDSGNAAPTYFKEKKKVKLNLSKANILSELSQYADTPDCLKDFLRKVGRCFSQGVDSVKMA